MIWIVSCPTVIAHSKKSTMRILELFAPRKGMQCITQLQGHLYIQIEGWNEGAFFLTLPNLFNSCIKTDQKKKTAVGSYVVPSFLVLYTQPLLWAFAVSECVGKAWHWKISNRESSNLNVPLWIHFKKMQIIQIICRAYYTSHPSDLLIFVHSNVYEIQFLPNLCVSDFFLCTRNRLVAMLDLLVPATDHI